MGFEVIEVHMHVHNMYLCHECMDACIIKLTLVLLQTVSS